MRNARNDGDIESLHCGNNDKFLAVNDQVASYLTSTTGVIAEPSL